MPIDPGQQGEHPAAAHLTEVEMAVADPGRSAAIAKSQLSSSSSPPAAVTPLTSATDRDGQLAQPAERVGGGRSTNRGKAHRVALQLDVPLEVAAGAEGAAGRR